MRSRVSMVCLLPVLILATSTTTATDAITPPRSSGGLCVVNGKANTESAPRQLGPGWIIHILQQDREALAAERETIDVWKIAGARAHASLWSGKTLPYADNLVNLVLCDSSTDVSDAELLRVLQPKGVAIISDGERSRSLEKPQLVDTDQWAHPWHGTGGGLATDDQLLGIPKGIQWVHGPLFAMAGRKTSTQSMVTAGGRLFAITQNVVENIGKPEMAQFLIARDAFNGLKIWQHQWEGPFTQGNGELNPRLAATSDRVYVGWFDGVEVFDAAAGEPIERIATPEAVTKLLVHNEHLLVQCDSRLACYGLDKAPSSKNWDFKESRIDGAVVDGERVYAVLLKRKPEGEKVGELVCLGLSNGELQWRIPTDTWAEAGRLRICFADDGYLALIAHGALHLLRGATGEHLWSQSSDARPGKSYSDERYVGHFYRHGLVWMQLENSPREPDGQALWAAFDPQTGKERQRLQTSGVWPRTAAPAKMGCQLMVASDRHIMIPRQATFVDFSTGQKHSFKFIRGGCGSGFVPANGMIYSSPHACGCYTEVIRGFLAAHSRAIPDASLLSGKDRLDQFSEASVSAAQSEQITSDDWPMHRRDPARTAAATTAPPERLSRRWSVRVGQSLDETEDAPWRLRSGMPITSPAIAAGTVYVCNVEEHQVVAIDDSTGNVRWRFTADGRVDSSPTLSEGRCLFGCHDGYVYCLRASDGELLWRYLAAPADRRIVAFGQVESPWPVAGAVLVQDEVVYAAAGRAPDADGGITVVALNALTGEELWRVRAGDEMVGMCDYLVGGPQGIFLANLTFDPESGDCSPAIEDSPHLRGGKAGLLEASWFDADLALRKSIHTWNACGADGQLLAMGAEGTFGYHVSEEGAATLFCTGSREWAIDVPAPRQVRALAATDRYLLSAAAKARHCPSEGGILALRNTEDGTTATEVDLPAPPVFDGLAVARQCVYASLVNGEVVSMGRPE